MGIPNFNHCMECGCKLVMKENPGEGMTPFCPDCGEFRFPVFNVACSMIVMDEAREHILLIKQYGGSEYILVAGYVTKGEDAEVTARREVKEELDMDVKELKFNRSHYFAPSNTLMLNFTVVVEGTTPHPNREIDSWKWFTLDEARKNIKKNGLANAFLNGYLDGCVYNFDKELTLV